MSKNTTHKKRKVIVESLGQAHIKTSFNNIIVSMTNLKGEVVSWSSSGKLGFKGGKKSTPYAALKVAEDSSKMAYDLGMRSVTILVKGPGAGKESAIRSIRNTGLLITEIIDITPIPHNGCRPPKRRRN